MPYRDHTFTSYVFCMKLVGLGTPRQTRGTRPTLCDDYNPACIISFMRHKLFIGYCLLVAVLFSCNSQTPQPSLQTTFYVYRFDLLPLLNSPKIFKW